MDNVCHDLIVAECSAKIRRCSPRFALMRFVAFCSLRDLNMSQYPFAQAQHRTEGHRLTKLWIAWVRKLSSEFARSTILGPRSLHKAFRGHVAAVSTLVALSLMGILAYQELPSPIFVISYWFLTRYRTIIERCAISQMDGPMNRSVFRSWCACVVSSSAGAVSARRSTCFTGTERERTLARGRNFVDGKHQNIAEVFL